MIDQEQTLDCLIRGGIECSISATLAVIVVVAAEVFTFIAYSVTVGIFASSLSPFAAGNVAQGAIRLGGAGLVLGSRYFLQYVEGKCYHSFRNWFVGGGQKLDRAWTNIGNSLDAIRQKHPTAAKVAWIAFPILVVSLAPFVPTLPLMYCAGAVLIHTIRSYHAATISYAEFQEFKKNNPGLVSNLRIAIRVAQIALPILSMIAYKTIGTAPFPTFFLAHTISMLIIPLKEALIQLE